MPFNQQKASEIHFDKYDYAEVVYKNIDTKVKIACPVHGAFYQSPYKHINLGQGCPSCKGSKISMSARMTKEHFMEKAINKHGNLYDYSLVDVVNAHTKVKIICSLHGIFQQTINNHIYTGNGCPHCGYNTSKPANEWLSEVAPDSEREYIISINGRRFKVDGYSKETNTVYEYFGRFWHGCPETTDHTKLNPRNNIPFKVLYENTLSRLDLLQKAGYNTVIKWGK